MAMPVRKIKKNYRNVTGICAATKAVGEAQFESTLERDFLRLLEFSPEIAEFEVQPLTLTWADDSGTERRYTPDVRVVFHESTGMKPWLCEVKYRSDLKENWSVLYPKFRQAIRYARKKGWRFRLITEKEIRGNTLEVAKFLLPFRRRNIPPDKAAHVLALVGTLKHTTPEGLLQHISADPLVQAEWLPAIWKAVALFQVGADFKSPLSMSSRLWSLS
ncbi:TnsA endonuclease N-terminal domain-containing protein [Azospira inquinata]|nr:TnsA endonuclease N-terminal domain-containing protein [Azospira inquinata]QWT47189.1 TnsA endonuclease N-terminal domain-containing protein [Azospira inquinata]